MVNVMGDALATGIMAHICRKDFMQEGDGVSLVLFLDSVPEVTPLTRDSRTVQMNKNGHHVTTVWIFCKPDVSIQMCHIINISCQM